MYLQWKFVLISVTKYTILTRIKAVYIKKRMHSLIGSRFRIHLFAEFNVRIIIIIIKYYIPFSVLIIYMSRFQVKLSYKPSTTLIILNFVRFALGA